MDCKDCCNLTWSIAVTGGLSIGMMPVGISALDACPVEPMIPIYLIGKEISL